VATGQQRSRRNFLKQAGASAGAVAFASGGLGASGGAAPTMQGLAPTPRSELPTLNRRTRGWLRFLWEKATTPDDWGGDGMPHQWWDRYSNPVVTSYGRFDLSF